MSTTEVETVTMLKSVELAIRRETQEDWEFADAVYEDVVENDQGVATPRENTSHSGLLAAEEKVYEAHRQAGTEVTPAALHNMFVTRRVWPPEERRPDLASFSVHYELRGKDFPNRKELIEKYAAKSRSGRWSLHDMRRWKSERKPAAFKTFLQLAEERIRRAVHDAGKPWHTVQETDRESIADLLRLIATEIEAGEFA